MKQLDNFFNADSNKPITIKPDYIILSDNISLDFSKKLSEITPKDPKKIIVVNSYDVPSGDFTSSEIQKRLIRFAKEWKTHFEQADGVMYYTILNKYAKQGTIFVSPGKHNSVFSVKDCLGFNFSEKQLETVLENDELTIMKPNYIGIQLVGQLPSDVMVKDLEIRLNTELKNKVNGEIIYINGEGFNSLTSLQQRDLIQSLGSLPTLTVFKKDVPNDFTFDLSETVRMVALPENISNGIPLKEIDKQPINSCLIGGATGSSIEDLRLAAKMLKGKKVPITMRLTVSPETSKVYDQAMEEGLVSIFIDANVQIIAPGYGSISRPSKAVVGDGETQIVTNYWNYMGYNGSKQSRTLIASTQTAIECALKQEIGTKLSVVEEV